MTPLTSRSSLLESAEGTTFASCVEWEYNVLAVRVVFILFMSDGSWRLRVHVE